MADEIQATCPICKESFSSSRDSLGDLVTCPHCEKHFQLAVQMTDAEEQEEPEEETSEPEDTGDGISKNDFRLFVLGAALAPLGIGLAVLLYLAWKTYRVSHKTASAE